MAQIKLGRTGITVEQNCFGALPIQRISNEDAVKIVRRAYEGGITYFDTARSYSDSEEKLGEAFSGMWDKIFVATKTPAENAKDFWTDLETSLTKLKTDHIDVFQFHNPEFCPMPGGEDGLYDAMVEAKRQGKIRFIGITNHRLHVAQEAAESGLYDTVQFPFSYLSTEAEQNLVKTCREKNVGFIAMKALSGGLITNSAAACAWICQFDNVAPIWGVQRMSELEEFLSYIPDPPKMTDEIKAVIEKDRKELFGDFCRGCGYCMPCPQGIIINDCARMSLMSRRAPTGAWGTPYWQEQMAKIETCLHCGQCASRCPYGLDTPALLERNYADYKETISKMKL